MATLSLPADSRVHPSALMLSDVTALKWSCTSKQYGEFHLQRLAKTGCNSACDHATCDTYSHLAKNTAVHDVVHFRAWCIQNQTLHRTTKKKPSVETSFDRNMQQERCKRDKRPCFGKSSGSAHLHGGDAGLCDEVPDPDLCIIPRGYNHGLLGREHHLQDNTPVQASTKSCEPPLSQVFTVSPVYTNTLCTITMPLI